MEKQQQITFTKGITNQPSDAICSDGELSNCVGLTAEYGELKPIQSPVRITDGVPGAKILAVHDGRYIYQSTSQGRNCLLFTDATHQGYLVTYFNGTLKDVEMIGNTVIASTSEEIRYALWVERPVDQYGQDQSGYKELGNKIPEPNLSMMMSGVTEKSLIVHYADFHDMEDDTIYSDQIQPWTDEVIGSYNKLLKQIHQDKKFAEPFVARVGVELYDGSYTMLSNPFIMLPFYSPKLVISGVVDSMLHDPTYFMHMKGYSLYVLSENGYDYTEWADIVRSVCVFVSRETGLFNVDSDAKWNVLGVGEQTLGRRMIGHQVELQGKWISTGVVKTVEVLDALPDEDVKQKLGDESVFFKLCDMGLSWGGGSKNTSSLFSYNVLDNIEAQQQLPNDDYHSHDNYCGSKLYAYNGRLHISGAKRYFFGGFKHFTPWYRSSDTNIEYHIEVTLRINGEDKTVSQSVTTKEAIGESYFYYPDPRAKVAYIYNGNRNNPVRTIYLTEHPGLNGAYWIDNFPQNTGYAPSLSPSTGAWIEEVAYEDLSDTIMVSEVDNPFLFLAKGYVKVNAPVVGMAAITMALSEYQHGHQPLVVFTEKGIWSLSLNAEGYYTSVQAVSREVCNNASSITQVDNGIYFVSQKGLMYLNTAGVRCVSDQMRGTDFDTFIDNCMIAYDYRDSLLHIYHRDSEVYEYTYVYNMKTGTFSELLGRFDNVVSNYPDTLVQYEASNTWLTYSFLQKPDEQSDGSYSGGTFIFNTYNAYIKTRPMKLENALALKTILQARHIHTIKTSQTTTIKFKVYASNNLDRDPNTWVQLTSLRGRPWKYYYFVYEFAGLKATDRFAGTMLITQERRTDKLR